MEKSGNAIIWPENVPSSEPREEVILSGSLYLGPVRVLSALLGGKSSSETYSRRMRVVSKGLFGVVFLLGGVGHADKPKPRDCSKAAMRKVRGDADKAVRAKDYAKAIALLEPVAHDCSDGRDPVASAWLASDLAVAYEKNGQFLECARLMAPLSHPRSGLQESANDKLVKAIEFNLDHCSKAFDAKYAAIKSGGCSLTIEHAIATAAAPEAVVPKGAAAACVALVPGKRGPKAADEDPEVRDVVCPRVALVWKTTKGLERQELAGGDGVLGDDGVCCNLSSIAAGAMDGKILVRVRGQGRDCSGGTADSASDAFYEWKGRALTSTLDASVGFH
jgi:hypothetical protein